MPLHKEDLDKLECPCGHPSCEDPIYLHAACHMKAGTWVRYFDGVLTIVCSICEKPVAEIAVAREAIELKRAPGTCCPEPGCDGFICSGCEYREVCFDDPQKFDYCPRPFKCKSCGADCTKCQLWLAPCLNIQEKSKEKEAK